MNIKLRASAMPHNKREKKKKEPFLHNGTEGCRFFCEKNKSPSSRSPENGKALFFCVTLGIWRHNNTGDPWCARENPSMVLGTLLILLVVKGGPSNKVS